MRIRITKNYGHLGHFPNFNVGQEIEVSKAPHESMTHAAVLVVYPDGDDAFRYPKDGLEVIK